MPGEAAALSREVVRDLIYQGFQARFLEAGADIGPGVDARAVVMARAMRSSSDGTGDVCFPGPLSPGALLALGATPLEYLRQLARKGTAPAAARTGGRNWTDLRRGLIGWDGPSGTMTQVLAGAAVAFAQRGQDRAALVFEEAAAVETGGWHEGMNFAAAQAAPLIVVLDEAGARRGARGDGHDVESIARAHGVACAAVADEPFAEVFATMAAARRRAVRGRGPTLVALLPADVAEPWAAHDAFVARAVEASEVAQSEVRAIERAASAAVSHALARLGREPAADPRDALVPVCTHDLPLPPWTRRTAPDPGWRGAAEPQDVQDAL